MDHDGKVIESGPERQLLRVEETKQWFLQTTEEFAKNQEKFDLGKEFAKTRKNRTPVVLLTIVGTCLAFGGFAWGAISYFDTNNKIVVQSKEFDDLNQRDMLDAVARVEADQVFAQTQLKQLDVDRASALQKVASDHADGVSMARTRYLDASVLQNQIRLLDDQLAATRAKIIKDFTTQAQPLQARLQEIQAQMTAFDPQQLAGAKAHAVVLNSERKLYDMEKDRFTKAYEDQIARLIADNNQRLGQKDSFIIALEKQAKETLVSEQNRITALYNPSFNDVASQVLLAREVDDQRLASYVAHIPQTYQKESLVSAADLERLNRRLAELRDISNLLVKTPYLNSVPPILRQLQYRSLEAVDQTVSYFDAFWQTILAREATIREREATIRERDATIVARETTIKERDATIATREATIKERDATIADQGTQIAALNTSLSASDAELIQTRSTNNETLAHSLFAYDQILAQTNQQAIVVDPRGTSPIVYVKADSNFTSEQEVVVLRNGTELIGEYTLSGAGLLRSLVPAKATGTPAAGGSNAKNAPKVPAVNDWVLRKEDHNVSGNTRPSATVSSGRR